MTVREFLRRVQDLGLSGASLSEIAAGVERSKRTVGLYLTWLEAEGAVEWRRFPKSPTKRWRLAGR